jgi:DNA modification methylase
MTDQKTFFLFKLRQNIALDGDLLLAKMELEAFLPKTTRPIEQIEDVAHEIPELTKLEGFGRLSSHVRDKGVQAFAADGPLSLLPELIRRISFVQRIYCVTQDNSSTQSLVADTEATLGPVVSSHSVEGRLIIQAVPHNALLEFSDIVAKRSKDIVDTKRNLQLLLDTLLDRREDQRGSALTSKALSAQSTTSHLSHDIHYYKAKFFPRLVRSMLNICEQSLGDGPHRVIDNFVGSGTALLEASILGIPSLGLDIDPLSALISRTKLEMVRQDSSLLVQETHRAIQILESQKTGQLLLPEFSPFQVKDVKIVFPSWLMKNRRMTPEMAAELGEEIAAVRAVVTSCDPRVENLFRVLMSDAISRRIRMRFLGTGVGRFSLTFSKTPLEQIFTRSLERYTKVAATFEWLLETLHLPAADAQVVEASATSIPQEVGEFDILVTSPPYLPASSGRESYAKARAPSLIALGITTHEDVDVLVDDSIGSMGGNGVDLSKLTDEEEKVVRWLEQDELRSIKANPTARYFLDMRQAFAEMHKILVPGALAVVVSGKQSTFYQFSTREALYVVPSAKMLADEALSVGFEIEALHDVQLQKTNKNARPRSLDDYYETLIVLRRP